ncbi:MAG: T9SS type A sorting domain-containing protein [Flavobacteriales bacterium]|nr:T9SS type A sorting domain-containing protein [Flavobacteriales bacterium]
MKLFFLSAFWLVSASIGWSQVNWDQMAEDIGIQPEDSSKGVAVFDFDRDGDDDIYFANSFGPNRFYVNQGNLQFDEMAEEYGLAGGDEYSLAAIWADYNNDGLVDLYVGNLNDPNQLYRNEGDGTFTEIASELGVDDDGAVRSVMWADVNGDNYLDLYVANMNEQNSFFINQGGESFLDLVYYTNTTDNQVAQGSIFFDFDNDHDLDLYLVHDAYQPFILLENDGEGIFTDVSEGSGTDLPLMGMAVDCGDYNNDGWLDLYTTILGENRLLSNNGDGTFSDISSEAGVTASGMAWGTHFFDFNNDRLQDLYISYDSNFSPQENVLYQNNGDSTFIQVAQDQAISSDLGGSGTAFGDFDLDGRLDVVVSNSSSSGYNEVFINQCDAGNWIGFSLEGVWSNYCAVGARVEVHHQHGTQIDEMLAGNGFASQHTDRFHFGLGEITEVDSIVVKWPSGVVESWTAPEVNVYHHFIEGQSVMEPVEIEIETVKDEPATSTTGVLDVGSEWLEVYPNPCEDILSFHGHFNGIYQCFDLSGCLVRNGLVVKGSNTIDVGSLSPGIYLLKANNKTIRFSKL